MPGGKNKINNFLDGFKDRRSRIFRFTVGSGWSLIRFIIMFGLCFVILYPFYIKIINGFKPLDDFLDPTVRFFPRNPTLDNIKLVIERVKYMSTFLETLKISAITAVLQTIVSAMAGYAFGRFKMIFSKALFFIVLLTLIVPPQTIMIPQFLRFQSFMGIPSLTLINTEAPVYILAATGLGLKNALYIFMFRQYFRNMPKELEEAAYIDGCGVIRTYVKIMLPPSLSIIVTVFMLSISWKWTDIYESTLYFRTINVFANTFDKALGVYTGLKASEHPIMMSNLVNLSAIMAILPLALIYIVCQRFFVQSVERSGIVG